ncbi:MAG TPA: helix-turn-helix transcriptional regulator [Rectinemataceae bacterium]|nr:helix-turn-helix transcriptional regulator [Rectinemataceae bacterium]
MSEAHQRIGKFFSAAFLGGAVLNTAVFAVEGFKNGPNPPNWLTIGSLLILAGIFLVTAYVRKLRVIQPITFLALVPFGFNTSVESFYGLGFFAAGVISLYEFQYLSKHRIITFISLLLYLYGVVLFWTLKFATVKNSFYPVFFMTVFLLFLFVTFRERIIVYLKEPKPKFSLGERGLSVAERCYVLSIIEGKTTKEIAFDYEVSESTVRNTLARAYKKLDVEDRADLAGLAAACDIVD